MTARASDWKILFETNPCLPFKKIYRAFEGHLVGGRMAFRAPSTLYVTEGDFGWDGVYSKIAVSQLPDYDYGKVMEIDLSTNSARQISSGNRNMQGVLIDDKGQLWVAEHGHRGGDELNRIVEGENYGWPLVTLGTRYNGMPLPDVRSVGRHDGFEPPVYAWLPSIAPSNLIQVKNFNEAWDGDFLLATLKDESLYRIRIVHDSVQFAERIPIGQRVRYVQQLPDGEIVLWTDNHALAFLSVGTDDLNEALVEKYLERTPQTKTERLQLQTAIETCRECHSYGVVASLSAPSLGLVFGEKVGSGSFANYSPAMRGHGGALDKGRADEIPR